MSFSPITMCAREKKKEKKCSYLFQPKQEDCQSVHTVIYSSGRSAEGSVCKAKGSCTTESQIPSGSI